MLIGIVTALVLWSILFVGCLIYAAAHKRHYINIPFLLMLLITMLLCGIIYGGVFQWGIA